MSDVNAIEMAQAMTLAHATHALEQSRRDVAAAEERATRAERELEHWRLRLRDRARRRKDKTEQASGVDWLAYRARVQEARGRHRFVMRPAFSKPFLAHLREPVPLPMSDAERRAICDRLGIDVAAWAQQIRERARDALNRLRVDDRSEEIAERHVCPGCHAVDEPCLPGCLDAEIAAEREHEREGPAWEQDEEDVDAELRAMGADPDAVADRGLAFVQMVKRGGPPPTSMLAMGKPPGDKR